MDCLWMNSLTRLILFQNLVHSLHCDDCGIKKQGDTDARKPWSHVMLTKVCEEPNDIKRHSMVSSFLR